MVLKIYFQPSSALLVCWLRSVCRMKWIPASMAKGEHKFPQYLEEKPFGQVPYVMS